MKFMETSKNVELNAFVGDQIIRVKAHLYPEGVAIFNYNDFYYAVEAKTGLEIFSLPNHGDLLRILRAKENQNFVMNQISKIRKQHLIINEIAE